MIDSHLHTPLCRHATGSPQAYVEMAQRVGLNGLVFTDHCPMPPWYDPNVRMRQEELPLYHALLEALRERSPLYVGIGLELDYHPGTEGFVRRLRQGYPYDYLIGSVHYLGAWPLDDPSFAQEFEERDLEELYRAYFALVGEAARSGLFHSIGHLDLPKKFGYRPPQGYLELAEPALRIIAEEGLALDVNTAGWRKPAQELYPAPALLARALELGIPVVLGSDAHRPEEVGWGFTEAAALLRQIGYRKVAYFREGQLKEEVL
jgi:histidinol-phosphatase (PHP family)